MLLIKTDSQGNEEWNKTFSRKDYDGGRSVQQTREGGYIIAGLTGSTWREANASENSDVWLIKTDSMGNEEWNKTFGGSSMAWGNSVQQTSDGGYIITGGYVADESDVDVWLIKTDSMGNIEWDEKFGRLNYDEGESVHQTRDGEYIVAGCTQSPAAGMDVWLIKVKAVIGSLSISSTPSGAEIYLDGDFKGTTPMTISDVPVGSHTIELTKEGYKNYSKDIIISAGKMTNVSVILPSLSSTPTPKPTPTLSPSPTLITTPTPTQPAFEAIFAIAGLLAVAYILKRRGQVKGGEKK